MPAARGHVEERDGRLGTFDEPAKLRHLPPRSLLSRGWGTVQHLADDFEWDSQPASQGDKGETAQLMPRVVPRSVVASLRHHQPERVVVPQG